MTSTNPIHLYRSLLREASYLPLPSCRNYIKDFIKQSFRRHHHPPKRDRQQTLFPSLDALLPATHKFSNGSILTLQRQTALLKRGRQLHSVLVQANRGDIKRFEKIICMTYGRTGRRRYELLHGFNSPIPGPREPPPEDRAPEPRDAKRSPHWKPPIQMEALLVSQAREQSLIPRSKKPRIKTALSSKNKTDIWGKPISTKRRTNKLHEWYLQNTRGVLPPLPAREYAELLDLVTGESRLPLIPTRRPVASSSSEPQDADQDRSINETSHLLLSGPQGRQDRLSSSSDPGSGSGFGGHPNARARFRPRFLKRRLARAALQQTPLAHATEKSPWGITFSWTDGRPSKVVYKTAIPTVADNKRQTDLLFGKS